MAPIAYEANETDGKKNERGKRTAPIIWKLSSAVDITTFERREKKLL